MTMGVLRTSPGAPPVWMKGGPQISQIRKIRQMDGVIRAKVTGIW